MNSFTDIPEGRIKKLMPPRVRACIELARLDRPTGIWLLLFPCLWGVALAGGGDPDLYALFALGAVVMRGAGCTLNDILDRKIDAEVERTRCRPLPSGRIGVPGALVFLAVQALLGLAILLQLNTRTIWLGCASLVLVALYPLMKRVTWWPQLFLGLTFNWGALMGWSAIGGTSAMPALVLYAAGIFWTLGYDTIYAHQDRLDDERIGVGSTARVFAARAKLPIVLFYAAFLGLTGAALALIGAEPKAYAYLGGAAALTGFILLRWKPDEPASCLASFKANRWIGLIVFAAIIAGRGCI